MSEDKPTPLQVPEPREQPDDAPMHVLTATLPDGRYCLLFTFDHDNTRE